MAYVKRTWVNGDIITANKLNHIEEGIGDAHDALTTKLSADDIDDTLAVTGKPADAKAVGEALENYVPIVKGNIFSDAELLYENGYASIYNGKISQKQNNNGMNAYLIAVDGMSTYSFTMCRFAFLVDSDKETAIGTLLQNVKQINSTGASYICFSLNYNSYSLETYVVSKGSELTPDNGIPRTIEPIATMLSDIDELKASIDVKPKFASITGNLASGGNLQLTAPKNNLRKGERIVFEGNITSFTSLLIGLSYTTSISEENLRNYFKIDDTNISYYPKSTSTPVTVAHGLTLSNNIQIIWEMTATASVKFTLISNGNLFSHEFTGFAKQAIGNPVVLSNATVLTDCELNWTCVDITKKIWMFGDSYIQYSNVRWSYYLHEYEYDQNCLMDGFAGEGSVNARVSFNNLLTYGTPKYAVWCMGMNDGSDSESAPSENWVSGRNYFLQYCEENGVTPIFGTIPTVPSINHEQKNAWIRNSGYRYIDFAKAVGADSSGNWYSGMLSNDNVHPSEAGAKALFAQVLIDLPEIMVDDF